MSSVRAVGEWGLVGVVRGGECRWEFDGAGFEYFNAEQISQLVRDGGLVVQNFDWHGRVLGGCQDLRQDLVGNQ